MLIEPVELTLAHVGLGTLNERALLALFGTAQAHALVMGTGHTLREVTDADGHTLYPAYLWLHLDVPPSKRLERFAVWDRVEIGVEVRRFGGMMLESKYLLGAAGELSGAPPQEVPVVPAMRAASLWTVDGAPADALPGRPKEGAIAPLPAITQMPEGVEAHRRVRSEPRASGVRAEGTRARVRYPLQLGRDVAAGHAVMFATYLDVLEAAEIAALTEHAWPPLPPELLTFRSTLEREVYFLQNTGRGQAAIADVHTRLLRCPCDLHGADARVVSAALLEVEIDVYEEAARTLLVVAKASKVFVVPRERVSVISGIARLCG